MTEEETAFTLIVDQDEDGCFFAYCAELKGIYGQGSTLEEALQEAEQSLDLAIAYYLESQKPLPLRKLIRVKKVVKTAASSSLKSDSRFKTVGMAGGKAARESLDLEPSRS